MRRSSLVVPLALIAGLVHADDPPAGALESLTAAERAFSALSVEKGMKDAFLTYLADDGILFRPVPIHGRTMWAARENPSGTLIWEPSFAEVSALGDLGVSAGPWEYRAPAGTDAPTAHGHFVSIWKREEDGAWKVAVDHGISHEAPATGGLGAVTFEPGPVHAFPPAANDSYGGLSIGGAVFGPGGGIGVGVGGVPLSPADEGYRDMAHEIHRMMSSERTLAFDMRGGGAGRAYPRVAAEDLRSYRDGAPPTVGITPAIAAAGPQPRALEFRPYGQKISGSYDLGYSYGLALRTLKGASKADTSGYLHVWRRDPAGAWKLSLELDVPTRPR